MSRVLFDADTHALPLIHDRAAVLAVVHVDERAARSVAPRGCRRCAASTKICGRLVVESASVNMRPDRFFPYGGQGAPSA